MHTFLFEKLFGKQVSVYLEVCPEVRGFHVGRREVGARGAQWCGRR